MTNILPTRATLQLLFLFILFFEGPKILAQDESPSQSNDLVVRKGRSYATLTFSLDQRNSENESQLIRRIIDQDRLSYGIVVGGGYALMDNFTLGLGLSYSRRREEITFLNQDDAEVTNNFLEQEFSIAPTMRNYIPLGKGTLQILIQTQLEFVFGDSLDRTLEANDVDKVEGSSLELNLGLSPGAILFFNRNWAFEATVDVVGLSYRQQTLTTNNDVDDKAKISNFGADLSINLLRLNLGIAYYF